jgi:hypothetical protein
MIRLDAELEDSYFILWILEAGATNVSCWILTASVSSLDMRIFLFCIVCWRKIFSPP